MISRRTIIILLLMALMVISGLAGTCIGIRIGKDKVRKRSVPEAWNVEAMKMLQRKLSLTPEQASKVQAVLDSGVDELRGVRADTLARTDKIINRLVGEHYGNATHDGVHQITGSAHKAAVNWCLDKLSANHRERTRGDAFIDLGDQGLVSERQL